LPDTTTSSTIHALAGLIILSFGTSRIEGDSAFSTARETSRNKCAKPF
jgi:hypothetical protein